MLRIVKVASDKKYKYQTWFDYPDPLDGILRQKLESTLKLVFEKAAIKDYKILTDTYGITVSFKSKATQKLFYKTFGETVSDITLENYFFCRANRLVRLQNISRPVGVGGRPLRFFDP